MLEMYLYVNLHICLDADKEGESQKDSKYLGMLLNIFLSKMNLLNRIFIDTPGQQKP